MSPTPPASNNSNTSGESPPETPKLRGAWGPSPQAMLAYLNERAAELHNYHHHYQSSIAPRINIHNAYPLLGHHAGHHPLSGTQTAQAPNWTPPNWTKLNFPEAYLRGSEEAISLVKRQVKQSACSLGRPSSRSVSPGEWVTAITDTRQQRLIGLCHKNQYSNNCFMDYIILNLWLKVITAENDLNLELISSISNELEIFQMNNALYRIVLIKFSSRSFLLAKYIDSI